MLRQSFNKDWAIVANDSLQDSLRSETGKSILITLPYDHMISQTRNPDHPSKSNTGYFPDLVCTYKKQFRVPAEWSDHIVTFEFEAVYRKSMVYINDSYAGSCKHGYSNFYIPAEKYLKPGEENEIKVVAKTAKDSRWYSGIGMYRNVNVLVGHPVHIEIDSYKIDIVDAGPELSVVELTFVLCNRSLRSSNTEIDSRMLDEGGKLVTSNNKPITAFANESTKVRQRFYLEKPSLWNPDRPYLYRIDTRVSENGVTLDEESSTFGIRTMQLDPVHGLRINGKTIKLRGACVHHDNGLIGAATIDRAEERRVEILKAAGFNAVRSAHNPISKAFLSACDRHGLLVMDELTDMWTERKTDFDYSEDFPDQFEAAIHAMVTKDYNHPSVILYSIGNEIPENGSAYGGGLARKLAEAFRSLDPSRYTVNSANLMLALMKRLHEFDPADGSVKTSAAGNSEINESMNRLGDWMERFSASDFALENTREALDACDIAGYNYAAVRYELDKGLLPDRVICGTETFPAEIAKNWPSVQALSHVIGDFTWTGWDYLGESGIGKISYGSDEDADKFYGEYPWLLANCGDIDILGLRKPVSYFREIAFGLRSDPYIAVRNPEHYGQAVKLSRWAFSDAIASWTWPGYEDKGIEVEIYADADRVELFLDDELLGSAEVQACRARLQTVYRPGVLAAKAIKGGRIVGQATIRTAESTVQIHAEADRRVIQADPSDLAYVLISIRDQNRIMNPSIEKRISVEVRGSGELIGLGNADPKNEASYQAKDTLTYQGYALAIIRPAAAGLIELSLSSEGLDAVDLSIEAREQPAQPQ